MHPSSTNHPCLVCGRPTTQWCSRQTAWYCSAEHLRSVRFCLLYRVIFVLSHSPFRVTPEAGFGK
ncbi:hypothetical protein C8R44DRAFT_810197 [Mycena epipterygia]|nr:hypothetical protein C8R44DRAFT_810197 [Mycena epipterygia]